MKKMDKRKVGIIIQARMTSKRFPKKIMAKLFDLPVIGHVVVRCAGVKNSDQLILAMPRDIASYDAIKFLKPWEDRMDIFLGSENDVLERYYLAAKEHGLDIIVRITGDCPLINAHIIGDVIELIRNNRKIDYASNVHPQRTFPKGLDVEAFTFDCLEAAHTLATLDYDREHVTSWMQNEPEVRKALLKNKIDQSEEENLCVDYPEDIERLEKFVKNKLQ